MKRKQLSSEEYVKLCGGEMTIMSDTPRTDAAPKIYAKHDCWVVIDFARQLERELNTERQCAEKAERELAEANAAFRNVRDAKTPDYENATREVLVDICRLLDRRYAASETTQASTWLALQSARRELIEARKALERAASCEAELEALKRVSAQDRENYQCSAKAGMAVEEKLKRELAASEAKLAEARKDTAAIAKLRALRPENMACDYWSRNMGFPVEQIEDILEELDAASEAWKGGAK